MALCRDEYERDNLPFKRPCIEPSFSACDEEYNLPTVQRSLGGAPMLYPSLLYQHQTEASKFHLAYQGSAGIFLPENLSATYGASKLTRSERSCIKGSLTNVDLDHDSYSQFDIWGLSAERSPRGSALTEDDILDMVLLPILSHISSLRVTDARQEINVCCVDIILNHFLAKRLFL